MTLPLGSERIVRLILCQPGCAASLRLRVPWDGWGRPVELQTGSKRLTLVDNSRHSFS